MVFFSFHFIFSWTGLTCYTRNDEHLSAPDHFEGDFERDERVCKPTHGSESARELSLAKPPFGFFFASSAGCQIHSWFIIGLTEDLGNAEILIIQEDCLAQCFFSSEKLFIPLNLFNRTIIKITFFMLMTASQYTSVNFLSSVVKFFFPYLPRTLSDLFRHYATLFG